MDITIRTADPRDAEDLLNIYKPYVEHTAVTFEQEVPYLEEFTCRIKNTLENYPYLAAVADGRTVGYIYAGRFRARASYVWSASTSIYIDRQYHRMGIGRMLYAELEKILAKQNVVNVYAAIANPTEEDEYLTRSSERFHSAIGYRTAARYTGCASKFGRWYNLIEMEKTIGTRVSPPGEFIPFARLEM